MTIERFLMERYQSLYWHEVDYDLSESGVQPMTIRELLGPAADAESFLATALGYPLSEGSEETRANVAAWYPGATAGNVTMVNGGSEANFLALWALLEPGDRLAFMVPNYMQGWGLGTAFGRASDRVRLRLADGGWQLDVDQLHDAVTKRTKAIMVCNPNNPTGHVLSETEMSEIVTAADRVGAWIVADEIYRGAELGSNISSPTFYGRYERVLVTSGLSKAFAMPGLRVGWAVAPPTMIERLWERHDYTTLSPSAVSDRLAAFAMLPEVREAILARTRLIVRENYPVLEAWLDTHRDIFTWDRPDAGAIAYAKYDLPIKSTTLAERARTERSVLLVPGDMFGLKKGLRFGFGYDIEHTMKGLSLVDEVLADVGREPEEAMVTRCEWAPLDQPRYLAYHDEEWGVPDHEDVHLFEMLTLEGAQAGLSWSTILNKRDGYRRAFAGFDPAKVARYSPTKIERLLTDPSIVRNRLKVESTVQNARTVLEMQAELGSLDAYLWSFVDGKPVVNTWRALGELPAETDTSRAMSKDMKRRGFRFVGPTVCYAFMQACGLVLDHVADCFRWREIKKLC